MTDVQRYLGTGTEPRDERGLTGAVPAHLPARLTVCLFDFSWYTRAGAGEPYADLDAVCADLADRGFNAIRICAAPLLTDGGLGLDDLARSLDIEGLGVVSEHGFLGQGTRWYDARGGYRLDMTQRVIDLVVAAARHGIVVILSSWEYQQSTAFAASRAWFDAIDAVPLHERYRHLASAWDRMLRRLDTAGLSKSIAFVELHNEVDFSMLPDFSRFGVEWLEWLQSRHPDLIFTVSLGRPPHLSMHELTPALGAAQLHVYCYGVLDELQKEVDIRSEGAADFPNAALQALLRPGAPAVAEYPRAEAWKYRATVVTDQMLYGYDWVDAEAWDRRLLDGIGRYRIMMRREIESRVISISRWARRQGILAVIGEGWIGYTPLASTFEEGDEGRALAEHGIDAALEHGVWGMVLGSNVAPHHPSWQLRDWQVAQNRRILDSPTR
jgi:hypothetical protein